MTNKLYEENSLLKTCAAEVVACDELGKGLFGVELTQTVLFPEGGGQLSDKGALVLPDGTRLPSAHSREVKTEAGVRVLHEVPSAVAVGTPVTVELDWTSRLDHMQQHTGEHILSWAFWKLYGLNNIGFHMSERLVTIDLDKEITAEQAAKAEDLANQELWADKPISMSYQPAAEAMQLPMRKKNTKLTGPVRVVAVEGGDVCTCCGTHPPRTGLVGLIKITKFYKHKGGTRVEFLCGRWALEDARAKMLVAQEASNLLSTSEEHVVEGLTKLQSEVAALRAKVREALLAAQAQTIAQLLAAPPTDSAGNKVLVAVEADYDPLAAKKMMQHLSDVPGAVVAVIYQNGERVNYAFGLGEGAQANCREMIAQANALFGGKGGGRPEGAQGGAALTPDWQEMAAQLKAWLLAQ